jgi:hypothetical protein
MPVSGLHRQLAAIALGAAARYGFALAGGNALIAHRVVNRFTADVDLFTDEETSVAAAAEAVEAALTTAGFQAERRDKTGGLGGRGSGAVGTVGGPVLDPARRHPRPQGTRPPQITHGSADSRAPPRNPCHSCGPRPGPP